MRRSFTHSHTHTCAKIKWSALRKRPRDLVGYGAHRRLTVTPTIFTRIDHQQRAMARRSCTAKQSMARHACVLIFSARATNGELPPNMLAMRQNKNPATCSHIAQPLDLERRRGKRGEGGNTVHVRRVCRRGLRVATNIDVSRSVLQRLTHYYMSSFADA